MKKFDLQDSCLFVGATSIVYGLFLIYEPLAYLVSGAALIRIGLPRKEVK